MKDLNKEKSIKLTELINALNNYKADIDSNNKEIMLLNNKTVDYNMIMKKLNDHITRNNELNQMIKNLEANSKLNENNELVNKLTDLTEKYNTINYQYSRLKEEYENYMLNTKSEFDNRNNYHNKQITAYQESERKMKEDYEYILSLKDNSLNDKQDMINQLVNENTTIKNQILLKEEVVNKKNEEIKGKMIYEKKMKIKNAIESKIINKI